MINWPPTPGTRYRVTPADLTVRPTKSTSFNEVFVGEVGIALYPTKSGSDEAWWFDWPALTDYPGRYTVTSFQAWQMELDSLVIDEIPI